MKLTVICALVSAACLSGCDGPARPPQSSASDSSTSDPARDSPSFVGRFVIVHSPHLEADTVLLDTVTGDTWQETSPDGDTKKGVSWEPVTRDPQPTPSPPLSNPQSTPSPGPS